MAAAETAVSFLVAKFEVHDIVTDNRLKHYAPSGHSDANIADA